nr:hypothetical protein [Tanacetum cinerariifolium]
DSDIPTPIVLIDQDSDPSATIVQVSFGDRLGALIDTMKALKSLGLDVAKGTVTTEGSVIETKFFITRLSTGRKVEDPDLLESIRLTIINNLLKYHPESSARLAMGEAFGIQAPVKKLDVDIATHIHVKNDGPKKSLLCIETEDRPGLLLEVIKIMADVNITVESAEIDTEGLVAKDKFHVSYRGAALNDSLSQVLTNCLRYYLRKSETSEDILVISKAGVVIFSGMGAVESRCCSVGETVIYKHYTVVGDMVRVVVEIRGGMGEEVVICRNNHNHPACKHKVEMIIYEDREDEVKPRVQNHFHPQRHE